MPFNFIQKIETIINKNVVFKSRLYLLQQNNEEKMNMFSLKSFISLVYKFPKAMLISSLKPSSMLSLKNVVYSL